MGGCRTGTVLLGVVAQCQVLRTGYAGLHTARLRGSRWCGARTGMPSVHGCLAAASFCGCSSAPLTAACPQFLTALQRPWACGCWMQCPRNPSPPFPTCTTAPATATAGHLSLPVPPKHLQPCGRFPHANMHAGWMHYQFNPTCRQTSSVLAFNAANVGTVNIPFALAASADDYLQVRGGGRARAVRMPACLGRLPRPTLPTVKFEDKEHPRVPSSLCVAAFELGLRICTFARPSLPARSACPVSL